MIVQLFLYNSLIHFSGSHVCVFGLVWKCIVWKGCILCITHFWKVCEWNAFEMFLETGVFVCVSSVSMTICMSVSVSVSVSACVSISQHQTCRCTVLNGRTFWKSCCWDTIRLTNSMRLLARFLDITYTYTQTDIPTSIHAYAHTYIHTYLYVCAYGNVCLYRFVYVYICTCMHAYIDACNHAEYLHIHTYIPIHAYTCIHTYIQDIPTFEQTNMLTYWHTCIHACILTHL